jgi:hypothetical protein
MAQLRLTKVQYYLQYYHTKICIFNDKKYQINYELHWELQSKYRNPVNTRFVSYLRDSVDLGRALHEAIKLNKDLYELLKSTRFGWKVLCVPNVPKWVMDM